ncbi:MAG TPA: hypothetical protein VGF94_30710 [Kofleriaceae bacterium]
MSASRWLAGFLVSMAVAAPARADGLFHRLARELRDHAAALRGPTPPHPIDVRFRAQKLGSLTLGAPLVALAAADLDGDGKAELYAVTTREVIAISAAGRLRELARVPFAGDPAVPQPRDPVGAAVVDRGVLVASASPWARGLRVSWQKGVLHADPGDADFALCATEHARLAPGRNYFGDGTATYYGVQCADVVDAHGAVVPARAQLSTSNKLAIELGRDRREYGNVGTAFAIGDLDRDGTPELAFAGAGAPGDSDHVVIVSFGDDVKKAKLWKRFVAEGVAGIAIGDVDGDGALEAIAATRLAGATVVDFWRLN